LAEIAKYIAKKKNERQETKLILATKKPDLFLRETTNKKKAVIKKPEHFKNEN
jgi:outer membrane lipoprotein-sorting protein